MKCPIDNSDLVMTERQGIEIDYCPKCRGVWLDRGELDKVIERAAVVPAPQPMPYQPMPYEPAPYAPPCDPMPEQGYQPPRRDYDDDDDDDGRRCRGRRRKSILGELFDFD